MADRNRNPQQALFNPRQGWPLGNRSAAGEFVQRGASSHTISSGTNNISTSVTFPVTFSTVVVVSAISNEVNMGGGEPLTTGVDIFSATTLRVITRISSGANVAANRVIPFYWTVIGT